MFGLCMKRKKYFEGWYFKHQEGKRTVIFIVGCQKEGNGRESAFIQLLTMQKSYYFEYPIESYQVNRKELHIQVGPNVFTEKGADIQILRKNLTIAGRFLYTRLTPIEYPAMGPLEYVPLLECYHGVISMKHQVRGYLMINEKMLVFHKGTGYIEQDYGISFPNSYVWTQCNRFNREDLAIMCAVATVPLLCFHVKGCISIIRYHGKEIRLATYLGARVRYANERKIIINQGKYDLVVLVSKNQGKSLLAPVDGKLIRTILESPNTKIMYKLYENGKRVFKCGSKYASFEYVE